MSVIASPGFQPIPSPLAIALPKEAVVAWCDRWQVQEFYLFGSVLRDDFHPGSDIDVMVVFTPRITWGFEWVTMQQELTNIFGRDVDLSTKTAIEESHNWIRRKEILETAQLIYVARQCIAR